MSCLRDKRYHARRGILNFFSDLPGMEEVQQQGAGLGPFCPPPAADEPVGGDAGHSLRAASTTTSEALAVRIQRPLGPFAFGPAGARRPVASRGRETGGEETSMASSPSFPFSAAAGMNRMPSPGVGPLRRPICLAAWTQYRKESGADAPDLALAFFLSSLALTLGGRCGQRLERWFSATMYRDWCRFIRFPG